MNNTKKTFLQSYIDTVNNLGGYSFSYVDNNDGTITLLGGPKERITATRETISALLTVYLKESWQD